MTENTCFHRKAIFKYGFYNKRELNYCVDKEVFQCSKCHSEIEIKTLHDKSGFNLDIKSSAKIMASIFGCPFGDWLTGFPKKDKWFVERLETSN